MGTILATFSSCKEAFFLSAQVEGKSKRTLELYEETLKRFERFLGQKDLTQVTPSGVRHFLFSLEEEGLAKATIWTHHKELSAFFRFATNEGLLEKNPMEAVKPPRLPKIFPKVTGEEEIRKLLNAAKGTSFEAIRNYTMLLTFLDTGVRVSELINLSLADVNLALRSIRVKGKGEKERVVYMGKRLSKAISSYLKIRGFMPYEDALFVTRKGEPLKRRNLLQILYRLSNKAGIKRVSPHTLRHTFATTYIKLGGDPFSLQRLLGHSDIKTVMIYVHMVGKSLKEAHAKYSPLDRAFN